MYKQEHPHHAAAKKEFQQEFQFLVEDDDDDYYFNDNRQGEHSDVESGEADDLVVVDDDQPLEGFPSTRRRYLNVDQDDINFHLHHGLVPSPRNRNRIHPSRRPGRFNSEANGTDANDAKVSEIGGYDRDSFDPYSKVGTILHGGASLGPLELVDVLGSGSFAVVYLAIPSKYRGDDGDDDDDQNGKPTTKYAVKCLFKRGLTPQQLDLQRNEARILEALADHPNVVHLMKVIETRECLYLVMEYCETDLFEAITTSTPASPSSPHPENEDVLFDRRTVHKVFAQLADVVAFCHKKGIYHRDLKPENVLINHDPKTGDMIVKLSDFGLATSVLRSTEYGCGSVRYMAPECLGPPSPPPPFSPRFSQQQPIGSWADDVDDDETLSVATADAAAEKGYDTCANDVWSLGVIAVNLVTGRNPWVEPASHDPTFSVYSTEFGWNIGSNTTLVDDDNHDGASKGGKTILGRQFGFSPEFDNVLKRVFCPEEDRVGVQELKEMVLGMDNFFGDDQEGKEGSHDESDDHQRVPEASSCDCGFCSSQAATLKHHQHLNNGVVSPRKTRSQQSRMSWASEASEMDYENVPVFADDIQTIQNVQQGDVDVEAGVYKDDAEGDKVFAVARARENQPFEGPHKLISSQKHEGGMETQLAYSNNNSNERVDSVVQDTTVLQQKEKEGKVSKDGLDLREIVVAGQHHQRATTASKATARRFQQRHQLVASLSSSSSASAAAAAVSNLTLSSRSSVESDVAGRSRGNRNRYHNMRKRRGAPAASTSPMDVAGHEDGSARYATDIAEERAESAEGVDSGVDLEIGGCVDAAETADATTECVVQIADSTANDPVAATPAGGQMKQIVRSATEALQSWMDHLVSFSTSSSTSSASSVKSKFAASMRSGLAPAPVKEIASQGQQQQNVEPSVPPTAGSRAGERKIHQSNATEADRTKPMRYQHPNHPSRVQQRSDRPTATPADRTTIVEPPRSPPIYIPQYYPQFHTGTSHYSRSRNNSGSYAMSTSPRGSNNGRSHNNTQNNPFASLSPRKGGGGAGFGNRYGNHGNGNNHHFNNNDHRRRDQRDRYHSNHQTHQNHQGGSHSPPAFSPPKFFNGPTSVSPRNSQNGAWRANGNRHGYRDERTDRERYSNHHQPTHRRAGGAAHVPSSNAAPSTNNKFENWRRNNAGAPSTRYGGYSNNATASTMSGGHQADENGNGSGMVRSGNGRCSKGVGFGVNWTGMGMGLGLGLDQCRPTMGMGLLEV
ncbi:hypothetical protein HK102_003971 [Quaeritorhiza haematococci]|nr:hypothetical protein HK102_003971 [Quaeritorhiza haematococci]